MNGQIGGQPIIVVPEGTFRESGKNAQLANIAAAKVVADAVRTTLGPKGMDKMLTDSLGEVVITNDGVTILEEMEIQHPAAKMVVEVAKAQDEEVGDGTTTAAVLTGELLKQAETLIEQKIHPTSIAQGYRLAKVKALEIINKIGIDVSIDDKDYLTKIALTSMTGKSSESAKEFLAKIAVEAITQVSVEDDGKIVIDLDQVKLEKKAGGSTDETTLISGLIIDKEIVHSSMPKKVENAKVALINSAIEVKELERDAQIRITDPAQMNAFIEQEEKMLKSMVDKIIASKANVVFCQKGVDDMAQHYLAKAGVMVARRVKKSDMDALSKATGGSVISNLDEILSSDLGSSGIVEEKKISGSEMIFVRKCKDPKSVSILVRGGTEHVVDEIERAMKDALGGVAASIEVGKIVAGGGAPEAEIAKELRKYSESVGGREQLAISAFANAMDIIPKTLAENAGIDPIDILVELRSQHDKGIKWAGIDVFQNSVKDMLKLGVVEPIKIKTQAIKSASEAAEMILRIDDVISASKLGGGGGMPEGMPPMGGGGMPPMM
ncbi:MAG: TCP-1/cpn60 chaperonin family protein [Candidatus Aenigmarchaeota archaeon]|nr:TCP-1/cpn60 chaperonin family protein [Candidatus Aenigmarchaeota archaeon]